MTQDNPVDGVADGRSEVSTSADEINELLAHAIGEALNSWGCARGLTPLRWLVLHWELGITLEGSLVGVRRSRRERLEGWVRALGLTQLDQDEVWYLDCEGWHIQIL
ncbi:hypothetical protein [Microbacterium sp. SORGH_AS_0888]|uniref:hypothetical protein n=1 Tax=Microbacterium sp. SORGH_AS_0888 TaxID=3041791 RepID=UPI0027D77AE2|nr:hypothetical protein [Microbacterium sp. SORGH_AS_0888]